MLVALACHLLLNAVLDIQRAKQVDGSVEEGLKPQLNSFQWELTPLLITLGRTWNLAPDMMSQEETD